jgi:hypothetical protein
LIDQSGTEMLCQTTTGQPVRAWAASQEKSMPENAEATENTPVSEPGGLPIFAPLLKPVAALVVEDEVAEERDWRSTGTAAGIPPGVIGHMVHKAIELWLFPDNPRLQRLLQASALDYGLAQPDQRTAAVNRANELLQRFYESPLRKEIEEAAERYHEVPYSRMVGDHAETGYIDLLYHSLSGWQILDFKTDSIQSDAHRSELVNNHARQLQRYESVVKQFLGQAAQTWICFLDDHSKVELVGLIG